MGGQRRTIPVSFLAAVRDGDMTQAQAARRCLMSRQAFEQRFIKFRAEQAQQRSPAAVRACSDFLKFCLSDGWPRTELDALDRLWWSRHDEEGNYLQSPRRWYVRK